MNMNVCVFVFLSFFCGCCCCQIRFDLSSCWVHSQVIFYSYGIFGFATLTNFHVDNIYYLSLAFLNFISVFMLKLRIYADAFYGCFLYEEATAV